MRLILSFREIGERDAPLVGGKAAALSRLSKAGVDVPAGVCATVKAYERFVERTGLGERLSLILDRKSFTELRWEEIWDVSLRIRNLFLNTPLPPDVKAALREGLDQFSGVPAVVRSSSPSEDAAGTSFAGLHESYVNVRGLDSLLDHILLVWASLWSDRALLYRKELGLDVARSAMAVIVQELAAGEKSGVAFSVSPHDPANAAVEAVYGLNQGLVDGTVEPDMWLLERASGKIVDFRAARRSEAIRSVAGGTALAELPESAKKTPPLGVGELARVFETVMKVEALFGGPQDMEWTFKGETLYVLQARPITARARGDGMSEGGEKPWERSDRRSWYLSLTRSLESLKRLRRRIEEELIPGMDADAQTLSGVDVNAMADRALADEIDRRRLIHGKWVDRYWADLIPFAHGARLFGQFYNDTVTPKDPFEFTALLGSEGLEGVERNRQLSEMAALVRNSGELREHLGEKMRSRRFEDIDPAIAARVDGFLESFGDTAGALSWGKGELLALILRLAEAKSARGGAGSRNLEKKTNAFFDRFTGEERERARDLLELGRASYRMRDNDNLHLARVEAQLGKSVEAGKKRLESRGLEAALLDSEQVAQVLRDPSNVPLVKPVPTVAAEPVELQDNPHLVPEKVVTSEGGFRLRARQLTGQPAGQGLAAGKARVVLGGADLMEFRPGEILVCDAIDPAMTFIVPLASGVVERRGGMLIHGAIIAREYGLPCVTGVQSATSLIKTGDSLVVDGYLGIVTLEGAGE